ncbi:MAG: hypothetical protein ABS79_02975 [Planctomycetes bacterium SCN 63-9]|nr:MAG: hypothetical protein ABS79_02975 [Planctomycetes bacterium SCN 63-9]
MSDQPRPNPTPASPRVVTAKVRGESDHDRLTSFLMAIVLGALLIVGWLALIYLTNQAYANRVTSPLQIIEVAGGGGGSPDGTPGLTEKIDVAGADASPLASNNEEEARDFEEPTVQATPGAMLEDVADTGESLAEADIGAAMPTGGIFASGKRASKLGTGGPGLGPGFGPGDGGVAREDRWSIVYSPGQTPEEYARQLDAIGVELAVVTSPTQFAFVSRFSDPKPTVRYGSGQGDNRLYFCWQGRGRKGSDVTLIEKAGIQVGDKDVFQFYPAGVEQELSRLEVRYRGRQPGEIRKTRFIVARKGNGYGFEVIAQETLK